MIIKVSISMDDDRALADWLWNEHKRLNVPRDALVKAVLIDAMLDAQEKSTTQQEAPAWTS